MQIALSIAGFDPSSGAGITADLAVFSAHGLFGTAAITALTVQSTLGVRAVGSTEPRLLAATLDEIVSDLPPAGIKIGMLATEPCVHVVADFLENILEKRRIPVVLDPVLVSSSGKDLLEAAGVRMLIARLLPLATWVTPNRQEWAVLTALDSPAAGENATIEKISQQIRHRWPETGFVVTGGEGDRADDLVLPPGQPPVWLSAEKIPGRSTHGTGCAFSSAMLCGLIQGLDGQAAATAAKAYVGEAIRRAVPLGQGLGPMNLLWPLTKASTQE